MSGTTSLTFNIDSSQAATAAATLQQMGASAVQAGGSIDNLTQGTARYQAEVAQATATVAQMRAAFQQAAGSLDDMIQRLDNARSHLSDSAQAFSMFSTVRQEVQGLGAAFDQTSTSLETFTKQATQIGLTSDQTVYALQRITDALTAQTAAGQAIRQTMVDYGVSLQGLTTGDADQALQRFVDKINSVADSAGKLRTVQSVLGPIDSTTYERIQDRDYVPLATQYERRTAATNLTQLNSTTAQIAQTERQSDQFNAQYSDLRQYYNADTSTIGDIKGFLGGLLPGGGFGNNTFSHQDAVTIGGRIGLSPHQVTTQDGQMKLMQWAQSNPDQPEARRMLLPTASPQQVATLNGGQPNAFQSWINHLTSGNYSANQTQIADDARVALRGDTSFFGLGLNTRWGAVMDSLKNDFNMYTPREPAQDTRPRSMADQQADDMAFATQLDSSGYGDSGFRNRADARYGLNAFNAPGVAGSFMATYGQDNGSIRYNNIQSRLQRNMDTAMNPGQSGLDANSAQGWLAGLPDDQEGQARALMQWVQKYAPDVDTSEWGRQGYSLSNVLNPSFDGKAALGSDRVTSFNQFFQGQVANQGAGADQSYNQNITIQTAMTAAVSQGSAAVQDAQTKWTTYFAVLGKTDDAEAQRQAQQKINEVLAERITQTQTLLDAQEKQNQADNISQTSINNAGTDPVARMAAGYAAGDFNAARALQLEGKLSQPGDVTQFYQGRQTGRAIQGVGDAADQLASTYQELQLQQQLLGVASQRADIQAKMQRDQQVDQAAIPDLAKAFGNDDATAKIEQAIAKVKELKDAIALANAEARLFQMGRDDTQAAMNQGAIDALPPGQRGMAGALQPGQTLATNSGISINNLPGQTPPPAVQAAIEAAVAQYNQAHPDNFIDPALAQAILRLEGGTDASGNPKMSSAGAFGAMQIMPGEVSSLGGGDRGNLQDNARMGVNQIGMLQQRFPGNPLAVGAGYNAGIGKYGPAVGLFATTGDSSLLPTETQNYTANLGTLLGSGAFISQQAGAALRYQTGVNHETQMLNESNDQAMRVYGATIPLIASGNTGAAAIAGAASNYSLSDPNGRLRAQLAAGGIQRQQGLNYIGDVASMSQSIKDNNDLADAYTKGAAAVDALNEKLKVKAEVQKDGTAVDQQAYAQLVKNADAARETANLGQYIGQMQLGDADIQSQLDAGFGSPLTRQRQAAARQTEAKISANPLGTNAAAARAQSLSDESLKEQLQDQQRLQQGFDTMGNAITSAFESAIVSGGNLRSVLAGLTQDLAKIALQMTIETPLKNAIGGFLGNLLPGAGAAAANGLPTSSLVNAAGYSGMSSTGSVFSGGYRSMFGSGGLIDHPTNFMMATGGTGLAGEMDTEAIMPLRRLANGDLGVQTGGGGGGGSQIHVNTPITINAGSTSGGKMDAKTMRTIQMQIDGAATVAVKRVIANERRPGGDLYF